MFIFILKARRLSVINLISKILNTKFNIEDIKFNIVFKIFNNIKYAKSACL